MSGDHLIPRLDEKPQIHVVERDESPPGCRNILGLPPLAEVGEKRSYSGGVVGPQKHPVIIQVFLEPLPWYPC